MSQPPPNVFDEVLKLFDPDRLLRDPRATGEGVRVCVVDSGIDRARLTEKFLAQGQELYPIEGGLFREDRPEPSPDEGRRAPARTAPRWPTSF